MKKLLALTILGAAALLLFAAYVWPTPYQYFTLHEPDVRPARVQRFTGETQLLGRWGWYTPKRPVDTTSLYDAYIAEQKTR